VVGVSRGLWTVGATRSHVSVVGWGCGGVRFGLSCWNRIVYSQCDRRSIHRLPYLTEMIDRGVGVSAVQSVESDSDAGGILPVESWKSASVIPTPRCRASGDNERDMQPLPERTGHGVPATLQHPAQRVELPLAVCEVRGIVQTRQVRHHPLVSEGLVPDKKTWTRLTPALLLLRCAGPQGLAGTSPGRRLPRLLVRSGRRGR
jgi:hypothetical protein